MPPSVHCLTHLIDCLWGTWREQSALLEEAHERLSVFWATIMDPRPENSLDAWRCLGMSSGQHLSLWWFQSQVLCDLHACRAWKVPPMLILLTLRYLSTHSCPKATFIVLKGKAKENNSFVFSQRRVSIYGIHTQADTQNCFGERKPHFPPSVRMEVS